MGVKGRVPTIKGKPAVRITGKLIKTIPNKYDPGKKVSLCNCEGDEVWLRNEKINIIHDLNVIDIELSYYNYLIKEKKL